MAKKQEDPFADIDEVISKEFDNIVDLSKQDTKIKTWYDSGVYAFNYICSKNLYGAYPKGRITGIDGLSGVGKSLMASVAMRDSKLDYILIIESEGGGNAEELIEFAGVDKRKVRVLKAQTLQSYKIDKKTRKIEEISDADIPKKKETDKYYYVEGAGSIVRRFAHSVQFNNINKNILILMDSLGNMQSIRGLQGCYTGDTLVSTLSGEKPISDVSIGDMVLTHLGNYKEVENKFDFNDKDEIVVINTEDGDEIKITPNHKLLVQRKERIEWIPAGDLSLEDELLRIE